MARSRRDAAKESRWRATVSAWRTSGLTVRGYCRRHQVAESSFHFWRRELRDREAASSPLPPAPTFVPVTVLPASPLPVTTVPVEVRCPSGHVVTLPACDASVLANLFAALAPLVPEGRPC